MLHFASFPSPYFLSVDFSNYFYKINKLLIFLFVVRCLLVKDRHNNNPSITKGDVPMTKTTAKFTAWDRFMAAITFAEADDEKSARKMIETRLQESECEHCCFLKTCMDAG